jgi:hypothetical protein
MKAQGKVIESDERVTETGLILEEHISSASTFQWLEGLLNYFENQNYSCCYGG